MTLGVLGVLLLGYEVVRINLAAGREQFWVQLLGRSDAVTLATVGFGLFVAGDQFARAARPTLQYKSRWVRRPLRLNVAAQGGDARFWQVVLWNSRQAPLEIVGIRWHFEHTRSGANIDFSTIDDLHNELKKRRLDEGADYWLVTVSPGVTVGSAPKQCYFECTESVAASAGMTLDAIFMFESMLGDQYEKRVRLLPATTRSNAVLDSTSEEIE